MLVGPGIAQQEFESLAAKSGDGVVVERNRHDFPALLARARVSVSQGGYNTVMDVLRSGAPAVVVPFEQRTETEQRMRTQRLAERGALELVEERHLAPTTLAAAIDRAATRTADTRVPFDMQGAQRSAQRIIELAQRSVSPPRPGSTSSR